MAILVLLPVAVALVFGFARIVHELRTGKLFAGEPKVYVSRDRNPRRYWFIMTLEIFLAMLVTIIVIRSWFKIFGNS